MNKKTYETPSIKIFEIAYMQTLLAGSGEITDIDGGDSGIDYGGGGSGDALARSFDDFDDFDDFDFDD